MPGCSEAEARAWTASIAIGRAGREVFSERSRIDQIKRSFKELADSLWRSQAFANGVVLLTGTGGRPRPAHRRRAIQGLTGVKCCALRTVTDRGFPGLRFELPGREKSPGTFLLVSRGKLSVAAARIAVVIVRKVAAARGAGLGC